METVVIEIQSRYKDMTSSGIKETSAKITQLTKSAENAGKSTKDAAAGTDRFTLSIQKTQQQAKKATIDLTDLATKMKNIASKVISIPVKVLDFATKPLRSIWNFATSLKGLITGFLAGQVWNKAVSGPLALADAYKSAYIGFKTLFKDQGRAQKMMNDLDEFARKTPFKSAGVISQSQKMLAMGWNPDDIIKDMKRIGDAAAATGKGDEGLQRISLALSQIKSKGKLSTEELNQLAEAGIGAKRYISQGLGLGSDDASLQKMSKMLEGGKIGADQAIGYILEGMKEYEGMMETTAKETFAGIKSNLEDTFEINIFRKWGLGLQEGAKQGLGTLVDLLDQNEDKLKAFGDTLQGIGADISKYLAERFKDATAALMELTQSRDFKKADLFGKISLAWDKVVAQPFNKWWGGEGGASFREKAEAFGESVGNSLAKGAITGFKSLLGNASKLIPGGEGADAMSWLSAGALLKSANGLGVTKLLGKIGGKVIGAGAGAAEAGAGLTVGLGTAAGTGGAMLGGMGLISAINDMKEAAKTVNTKTRQDYMIQGATKAGMVAAGTALGAAIGSIIPGLGTLLGAGLGAGVGGVGALLAGGGLGKTISDAADGTTKLRELGSAASDAKDKVTEAHTAASDFATLVDKYKQVNFVVQLAEGEKNPEIEQGLKDKLTEIQTQAANIEAKLKGGGLNKGDRAGLEAELNTLNLKKITIAAILGKTLDDTEKTKLTDRITEIEKEKVDIEAKLKGGGLRKGDRVKLNAQLITLNKEEVVINAMLGKTLDETEKTKLTDRITELEKEKVEVDAQLSDTTNLTEAEKTTLSVKKANIQAELIGLKAAVGTLDTTNIDGQLEALKADKMFLLSVGKGADTLDASTRAMVDKALSDNEIATLALQVTASGLSEDEKQGYIDRINEISAALETASGGLVNQQSLLNDAYDTSIARLERILQLKEQEARIADSELMQNVYNNRNNGAGAKFETKLSEQEQKSKDDIAEADKYTEAATALQNWGQGVRDAQTKNRISGVKGNDFGVTDEQNTAFNQQLVDLYQKYGSYFGAANPYSSGNYREYYEGILGYGSPMVSGIIGKAQAHNLSAQQNEEQYYQTQSEYGNLYGNELAMIQRNLEKRYGGTYGELSGKFFSGTNEDRNAFMKMVQGIESLGKMFPGLEESFKFGGDQLIESLKPFITGDVVQSFAGRKKVSGSDPMSLLNNYLVDLSEQGISGAFEADKSSVKDISSKVTGGTATKDEVKTMQETLQKYGYDLGKSGADGIAGAKTKAAMQQFQEDIDSGKLTLDTLPDSVTNATSSIDGLSSAAQSFAEWVTTNIAGANPTTGGMPGTPGTAGTGVYGDTSGSGSGGSSGLSGSLKQYTDAVSTAASNLATGIGTAASSVDTFDSKMGNASGAASSFASKVNNLNLGGHGAFASGGFVNGAQTALVGEDGPEAIIPLSERRRDRGMSLWQKAGRALGVRMYADGGIVGGEAIASAPSGAMVQVGGVQISIDVHGGGDAASVVAAIKEKMPEVANAVAEQIARNLEKSYSNMPVTEG